MQLCYGVVSRVQTATGGTHRRAQPSYLREVQNAVGK